MPHHRHHHGDHGPLGHGHGHHEGHKRSHHPEHHAHGHGQHRSSPEATAPAQPGLSRPTRSNEPASHPREEGCPKRGGTGDCSGDCGTCPNRLC